MYWLAASALAKIVVCSSRSYKRLAQPGFAGAVTCLLEHTVNCAANGLLVREQPAIFKFLRVLAAAVLSFSSSRI